MLANHAGGRYTSFAAVREVRPFSADAHRYDNAFGGPGARQLHRGHRQTIRLVGERARCQLIPGGVYRRKYPTHALTVSAELNPQTGTARMDTVRRRRRALRPPNTSTPTASPVRPIQIHSADGVDQVREPVDFGDSLCNLDSVLSPQVT